MAPDCKYIWMDGKLVETAQATVSFLTSALHFGQGVFEGIRCYETSRGPAVFRHREHMQRLIDSAHILGFRSLPYTVDELMEATRQLIRANEQTSCYIRPVIYLDCELPTLNLDLGFARVGIASWYWGSYLGEEAREKGVRANVASFTRHHINVTMTKAKVTGNYANSTLAKTESTRLGFDEAIMLDPQGYVSECTGENLFLVRGGKLYCPTTATVLEGITRDALFTLIADLGYEIVQQPVSRDQLYIADEVFVCGTAAECIAVTEIDFRTIGSGRMGPITRKVQEAFFASVHGEHPRSAQWLDYVNL